MILATIDKATMSPLQLFLCDILDESSRAITSYEIQPDNARAPITCKRIRGTSPLSNENRVHPQREIGSTPPLETFLSGILDDSENTSYDIQPDNARLPKRRTFAPSPRRSTGVHRQQKSELRWDSNRMQEQALVSPDRVVSPVARTPDQVEKKISLPRSAMSLPNMHPMVFSADVRNGDSCPVEAIDQVLLIVVDSVGFNEK
jgi:hypothetical protein